MASGHEWLEAQSIKCGRLSPTWVRNLYAGTKSPSVHSSKWAHVGTRQFNVVDRGRLACSLCKGYKCL